jgi:hypothetical protein
VLFHWIEGENLRWADAEPPQTLHGPVMIARHNADLYNVAEKRH